MMECLAAVLLRWMDCMTALSLCSHCWSWEYIMRKCCSRCLVDACASGAPKDWRTSTKAELPCRLLLVINHHPPPPLSCVLHTALNAHELCAHVRVSRSNTILPQTCQTRIEQSTVLVASCFNNYFAKQQRKQKGEKCERNRRLEWSRSRERKETGRAATPARSGLSRRRCSWRCIGRGGPRLLWPLVWHELSRVTATQ